MNKLSCVTIFGLLLLHTVVRAESPTVFEFTVDKPMSEVYPEMLSGIEDSKLYLFLELDIGKNLSYFAESWGNDYNQNDLTAIRSIVFCNGWYANQVSNKDPNMLGLCPLHITLIEKDGKTTALFNRPTVISRGSAAHEVVAVIEQEVIKVIKNAMQ